MFAAAGVPNSLYNSTIFPCFGNPETLFTFKTLPISKLTATSLLIPTSLGLSTSRIVVPTFSTSYPLTYALPEDNLRHIKSFDGVFNCSVLSFLKYNPPLPKLSFNELCNVN